MIDFLSGKGGGGGESSPPSSPPPAKVLKTAGVSPGIDQPPIQRVVSSNAHGTETTSLHTTQDSLVTF